MLLIRPIVLVVEDDLDVRETVAHMLRDEGYEVVEAADGIQALTRLETRTPDLILLDLKMPRMDGLQFVSALRKRHRQLSIPIIVLSAYPALERHIASLAIAHFLQKPVECGELLRLTRDVLLGVHARGARLGGAPMHN